MQLAYNAERYVMTVEVISLSFSSQTEITAKQKRRLNWDIKAHEQL